LTDIQEQHAFIDKEPCDQHFAPHIFDECSNQRLGKVSATHHSHTQQKEAERIFSKLFVTLNQHHRTKNSNVQLRNS